jgi:hypothetical protein
MTIRDLVLCFIVAHQAGHLSVVRADDTAICKGHRAVMAPCMTVHGRLSLWNGTPTRRIWKIGTRRMLGVREGFELPRNIRSYMETTDHQLYGDCEVCPLTREERGVMQMVCVESARNLVLDTLRSDGTSDVRRLTDTK